MAAIRDHPILALFHRDAGPADQAGDHFAGITGLCTDFNGRRDHQVGCLRSLPLAQIGPVYPSQVSIDLAGEHPLVHCIQYFQLRAIGQLAGTALAEGGFLVQAGEGGGNMSLPARFPAQDPYRTRLEFQERQALAQLLQLGLIKHASPQLERRVLQSLDFDLE